MSPVLYAFCANGFLKGFDNIAHPLLESSQALIFENDKPPPIIAQTLSDRFDKDLRKDYEENSC
jgi:hypothetical protein